MSKIKTCVSLYSLQTEYVTKRMNLEDIFKFMHDNNVEGVEILPDQMLPGAPKLSDASIAEWHRMCKEYNVQPLIADVFLNTNLYKNRTLTKKECVDLLIDEIKMAHDLGMTQIRLVSMTPAFVLEPLLPYCEKYNVKMGLEIHGGLSFNKQKTIDYLAEMKRLDSPYVGLVVDTGIFIERVPRVMETFCRDVFGATPELIDEINKMFREGKDGQSIFSPDGSYLPELQALDKTYGDHQFLENVINYENMPLSVLDDLMKYVFHFHFKLFEMTEDGEYSVNYKKILQYLHDHDYDGYVSTEYEGNRWTLPGEPIQEKEQIIAHQRYIQKCIKEIQG